MAHRDESELAELISELNEAEFSHVELVLKTLVVDIHPELNPHSTLMTPPFADEFAVRLKVHHATHTKPLDRVGIEDAFRAASRAAGRDVRGNNLATTPFIDEVVDGEGVALKGSAAKDVRRTFVHISKLCEAAWIQDVRGPQAREARTKELFVRFLDIVHRMYILRVIPDDDVWAYEFVEVPIDLFRPILDLDRAQFSADGPIIAVADIDGPCLTLKLDRSDSKITIARIPIERCIVHARWTIPKDITAPRPK